MPGVRTKKKETPNGHYGLYLQVRRLYAIVHRERKAHPRTKVWKDLEEITDAIHEIQQDWFAKSK
jgi:hypothetical protein